MGDGTIYEGDWALNKKCGHGELIWTDGSRYEGQWKEDLRHG